MCVCVCMCKIIFLSKAMRLSLDLVFLAILVYHLKFYLFVIEAAVYEI